MTKEDVLQKVNDYCDEKSYTSETLTDEFKSQFADFFCKKNADADINDEGILDDLHFNLNTAFSATSKGITLKVNEFRVKENNYKEQIAKLSKKPKPTPTDDDASDSNDDDNDSIADELREQLKELQNFKNEQKRNEKFKEVLALAKKGVRQDLHTTLEKYAQDFTVTLDDSSEEQAKKLTNRFQEIFKDSIGNIKPLAPRISEKRDEEFLGSIPKVKI